MASLCGPPCLWRIRRWSVSRSSGAAKASTGPLTFPPHQPADHLQGRWIVGKHDRQLFRALGPVALAPDHRFHRTATRAVKIGELALRLVRPDGTERHACFLEVGIEDRRWIVGTIDCEVVCSSAIIDQDEERPFAERRDFLLA